MPRLLLLLAAAAFCSTQAEASVANLSAGLASTNLAVRTQAQVDLMKEAAHAARPGAEAERTAYCADLCRALSNDCPPVVAVQLVRQLQRIGMDESVDTLQRLLQHPDPNVRDDVRQTLEVNPSPRAGAVLLDAWQPSGDEAWTIGLITSLGQRGEIRAVEPLSQALQDARPRVAAAAATALGRIPHPRAATALRRALTPDRTDVAAGILEMAQRETQEGNATLAARLYRTLTRAEAPADVHVRAWIGLLTALPDKAAEFVAPFSDPVVLAAAIEASTQIESPSLSDHIAGQLASASPAMQVRILAALETTGESKYAPLAADLLTSKHERVVHTAIQTLGAIGTQAEMAALMEHDRGLDALARIPDPGIDDALAVKAKQGKIDDRVRAIQLIGMRAMPAASAQLVSLARDPDPQVATAALGALENVATVNDLTTVASIMLDADSSAVSRAALHTVIAINRNTSEPERAAQILIDQLSAASGTDRSLLFTAFTRIGNDVTLGHIVAAIESGDTEQREAGLKALGSWPEPNAIKPLLATAGDASLDVTSHVLLMRALARLLDVGRDTDIGLCQQGLEVARRPEEKRRLLSILGKSRNRKALALIEPYLADPELAEAAELAQDALSDR